MEQEPRGAFVIDESTGEVKVTRPLDREALATYQVSPDRVLSLSLSPSLLNFIFELSESCVPSFFFLVLDLVCYTWDFSNFDFRYLWCLIARVISVTRIQQEQAAASVVKDLIL